MFQKGIHHLESKNNKLEKKHIMSDTSQKTI
jgi:hypothetical protein